MLRIFSVQYFEDYNFNKVLPSSYWESHKTCFLSKAADRDAVEQPRSQFKYNIVFYSGLLTTQEHDCFTSWEQYGQTGRCKTLFLDEQSQMKALLFYISLIKSHNTTPPPELCIAPQTLYTRACGHQLQGGSWGPCQDLSIQVNFRVLWSHPSSALQLYSSRGKTTISIQSLLSKGSEN